MFARKYRLPATTRQENVKTIHSPFYILKLRKNNGDTNRYGFVISKRIDKRATVRNKVKRRIRGCVENMNKKIVSGHDLLFIIKKEAIDKASLELYASLKEILVKEKLLK